MDSLTWLTLPGAEDISSLYMVWMESMTTIRGLSVSIALSICSRLVSHRNFSSPVTGPMRLALILICFRDSSPEMYRTRCPAPARCLHTWSRRVDFPMPGSPPTNTREPATIPSPSTRSSSPKPVDTRSCSSMSISDSRDGLAAGIADFWLPEARRPNPPWLPADFETGSSTMEFHALQAGHCPIHLDDSYPHSLQKNAVVLAFAMIAS